MAHSSGIKGWVPSHPVLQPHVRPLRGSQGFHLVNPSRYFMCTSECEHCRISYVLGFLSWQPHGAATETNKKYSQQARPPGNGPEPVYMKEKCEWK